VPVDCDIPPLNDERLARNAVSRFQSAPHLSGKAEAARKFAGPCLIEMGQVLRHDHAIAAEAPFHGRERLKLLQDWLQGVAAFVAEPVGREDVAPAHGESAVRTEWLSTDVAMLCHTPPLYH
jgi:hypothetical protein